MKILRSHDRLRPSYLFNRNPYTEKTTYSYIIWAQVSISGHMCPIVLPSYSRVTWKDGWGPIWLIIVTWLTLWGRVTHICVGKLTIIGSDNGLSPGRHQAIIWTNAGILLIRPLGTNFSEILSGIQTFSFKKIYLKMSSAKWRPFCLGLNVLTTGKMGRMYSRSRRLGNFSLN